MFATAQNIILQRYSSPFGMQQISINVFFKCQTHIFIAFRCHKYSMLKTSAPVYTLQTAGRRGRDAMAANESPAENTVLRANHKPRDVMGARKCIPYELKKCREVSVTSRGTQQGGFTCMTDRERHSVVVRRLCSAGYSQACV